ncbi:TolC family protein [Parabacteroides gordonii]|jgi:outer membrane protein TolC|uniref:TolC family protein n=1 Tax=Parabacteroides gordonii TaxID=574930 RepID=UPI00241DC976|nr:TolC family protein [Parabacteroides gordonii]
MKQFIIIATLASAVLSASGQNSIDEVLRSIEANNKELQANKQLVASQKLEAKLDNNLADPTVTYSHLYGNREGMGFTGEFVASQSFDFPSLYVQRGKLAKLRGEGIEHQGEEFRQQTLLQAKEVCLDLVLLNQQKSLLEIRRRNAEQLSALYEQRLQNGDANILETNKINLELLNVRNEARVNEANRVAKLHELAMLNGGVELQFADTVYTPVEAPVSVAGLKQEIVSSDRRLQSLRSAQTAARKQISVSRAQSLPSFELGYRMNPSSGGERFNGFLVGVSIPLFANRNKVKQAKAQSLYTELQTESMQTAVESELLQLYNRSVSLKASIDEYSEVLEKQNNLALLNKAIRSGQISMIEYFADVTTLYQSMQNYMQLQNEYQKVMAQLYKYKL